MSGELVNFSVFLGVWGNFEILIVIYQWIWGVRDLQYRGKGRSIFWERRVKSRGKGDSGK